MVLDLFGLPRSPRSPAASPWTEKRLRYLRRRWSEGARAREIGAELGVTANAVIAKIHRLGIARLSPYGGAPGRRLALQNIPRTGGHNTPAGAPSPRAGRDQRPGPIRASATSRMRGSTRRSRVLSAVRSLRSATRAAGDRWAIRPLPSSSSAARTSRPTSPTAPRTARAPIADRGREPAMRARSERQTRSAPSPVYGGGVGRGEQARIFLHAPP